MWALPIKPPSGRWHSTWAPGSCPRARDPTPLPLEDSPLAGSATDANCRAVSAPPKITLKKRNSSNTSCSYFLAQNMILEDRSLILSQSKLDFKNFFFILFIFRERGREGDTEGEKHGCERDTSIGCLSHARNWGLNLLPRPVL